MKATLSSILSLILLCVALAGCSGKRDIERRLDMADSVMDSAPDSALSILEAIDHSRLSEEGTARHALLLSQAYDKNLVDIADDSLIAIARSYYITHPGNRDMLALAYYYSGVVAFNATDYPGSIYYLSLSDTLAAGLDDHHLRGMANSMLAWNNSELLDLENEYCYAERALRFFTLADDSARIGKQKLYVAICHLQLNRPADALALLDSPGCVPEPVTRASSLVGLGRLDEFKSMLEQYPYLTDDSKLMSDYARCLVASGNLRDADSALAKAYRNVKNSSDSASYMGAKAELLKSRNEWQQYASIADHRLAVLDSDNRKAVRNANARSRAEALLFLANNEKKELQLRNLRLTVWGSAGTMLVVLLIYLIILFIKKKSRSDRQFERHIAQQQRDILSAKEYQSALEHKITEQETSSAILIKKYYKLSQTNEALVNARCKYDSETLQESVANLKAELISLCKKYREISSDHKERRRNCREEIMSVYTPGCKGLFECYVNKTYGNIIAIARNTGFDDEDINMAVLDKLSFSNEEISILFNMVSSGATATRKSRIRAKLKNLSM